MRGAQSGEIRSLTGLRFIAAISIAFTHYAINAHATIFGLKPELAALGMPLFFTLSGFVIHYVYSQSFASSPSKAVKAFAIARFSRIYPLFLLFFLFYLLFRTLGDYVSSPGIAVSYGTLTATWWYWQVGGHTMMDQPFGFSWSIATECFFYLCYAVWLYRISHIRRWEHCAAWIACLGVFSCALVWLISDRFLSWEPFLLNTVFQNGVSWNKDPKNSVLFWFLFYSPYVQIIPFAVGCLTAQLYNIVIARSPDRRVSEYLFWAGSVWVAGFLFLYLKLSTDEFVVWGKLLTLPQTNVVRSNLILIPGLAAIILGLGLDCAVSRILAAAPLVLLGEASYSLYLGHPVLISAVGVESDMFRWPSLAIALAMACFLAIGTYMAFELPAKRWVRAGLTRLLSRHAAAIEIIRAPEPLRKVETDSSRSASAG